MESRNIRRLEDGNMNKKEIEKAVLSALNKWLFSVIVGAAFGITVMELLFR